MLCLETHPINLKHTFNPMYVAYEKQLSDKVTAERHIEKKFKTLFDKTEILISVYSDKIHGFLS